MKYYTERPQSYQVRYGRTYTCNHELYSNCTLYQIEELGLAVIQQRFNHRLKILRWTAIDPWLIDDIYLRPGFNKYFNDHAGPQTDGIYPTVTVRQIMWALRMKPLKRQSWEIRT